MVIFPLCPNEAFSTDVNRICHQAELIKLESNQRKILASAESGRSRERATLPSDERSPGPAKGPADGVTAMMFLIRMAFWFSLVLLLMPLDPAGSSSGVSPLQAFFAAQEAINDAAGICERKPDVCETGKAAMQTIGVRAREGARIAMEMLDDGETPASTDEATTGSVSAE